MVVLTNVGTTYDATTASRGLGIATLDFTGVTQLVFRVRVNKVGTGVQSWQLWNETDLTEIALLTDAGAAGVKTLKTTVSVALVGVKDVCVRVRSTVGSDDPVYLGAAYLLVVP